MIMSVCVCSCDYWRESLIRHANYLADFAAHWHSVDMQKFVPASYIVANMQLYIATLGRDIISAV